MSVFVKDKQFYDTFESSASTRFTDTGLSRKQDLISPKQKLAQSPDNKLTQNQENEEEEFTQNFKVHYDAAEEALMLGKKLSRDCKLEENDLEYALNVLRIKTQKDLNEIEFSLRPTIEKSQYRLTTQQTNFEIINCEAKKACKMINLDFEEIQVGFQECVSRVNELERKTGNWHMFKKKAIQAEEQEETQKQSNAYAQKKPLIKQ